MSPPVKTDTAQVRHSPPAPQLPVFGKRRRSQQEKTVLLRERSHHRRCMHTREKHALPTSILCIKPFRQWIIELDTSNEHSHS